VAKTQRVNPALTKRQEMYSLQTRLQGVTLFERCGNPSPAGLTRGFARCQVNGLKNTLRLLNGSNPKPESQPISARRYPAGRQWMARTRRQLCVLAHECGHIALGHVANGYSYSKRKPRHVEEYEACKCAIEALRRHGVAVPRLMIARDKT
jgi:hypothetical protein